jgi:hypothetical protein
MGRHPARVSGTILDHGQEVALPGAVGPTHELRLGVAVVSDLVQKLMLCCEPLVVSDMDVSNTLRDRGTSGEAPHEGAR